MGLETLPCGDEGFERRHGPFHNKHDLRKYKIPNKRQENKKIKNRKGYIHFYMYIFFPPQKKKEGNERTTLD